MPSGTQDSAADNSGAASNEVRINGALTLMLRALELLDMSDGPRDVGANLDLAIVRLQEFVEKRQDISG